ncbi:ABC transporter substrate-binding protein [Mycobacterium kubicae]|uniref:ABC transporter substrate-binding protein n=1 Tax=Mycobacterium kubicae TaxID=120959 RepID=A0AAX1J5E3_9MYCO|nr:ABC transporter substrate-binding protein [Mycobacterium kubicae]MCV7094617.1 ABC transporter substrate-binding protein [Mycobacterium kubicae]ORV97591.1 ABC transporter substrate-binding protein [Mycobacterium kubicae]QNI12965.1 ABC transporter substrate-binding protein [Mycobacterium kubicae]QPI36481.1 ABC transporter substrate-binding protein [Mycobacterium kubicae]GFG67568.1 ABC transporter substrate-binding protein [Mycobacterium kubicae]
MTGGLVSRRSLLAGTVAVAAAGGLAGVADLARAASVDRTNTSGQLRVGYLPITDAAPLLIAHADGLYQRGVVSPAKPVLFRSWASLAEAFVTRQVDAVHMLMPTAIQLRFLLKSPVRVLSWNHTNGSALTVAPNITDLGQLAGTQVAIPFWWSIHNIILQQLLRAHDLVPVVRRSASRSARTVELIVMSPSDMVPALANRSISGYVVADPFNAMAQVRKIGRIHTFLGDVWRDHACCVVLAHDDLIEHRPEAAASLVNSIVGAQQRINTDRPVAAATLSKGSYLPQPLPAIKTALTYRPQDYRFLHPDWQPQRLGYQPFPFPSFTQRLVEAMHDTVVDGDRNFLDRLDPAAVHSELVVDSFVRSALTAHGGPQTFGIPSDLTRTEQVQPR